MVGLRGNVADNQGHGRGLSELLLGLTWRCLLCLEQRLGKRRGLWRDCINWRIDIDHSIEITCESLIIVLGILEFLIRCMVSTGLWSL